MVSHTNSLTIGLNNWFMECMLLMHFYCVCISFFPSYVRPKAHCTPQLLNFSCNLCELCTTPDLPVSYIIVFMFTSHSNRLWSFNFTSFVSFLFASISRMHFMFSICECAVVCVTVSIERSVCLFVCLWVADLWFNLIVDEVKMSEDESLRLYQSLGVCMSVCVYVDLSTQ